VKAIKEMSIPELAAFVQSGLRDKGIDVVLSGGACVTIYSENKYVSMDIDLVNNHFASRREIREAMLVLGFEEHGRHFMHPDSDLFVEFPAGPLSIGEEPVKEVREIRFDTGLLRIISPTDCVKDRLAAYYHWNDAQCLEQAVLVSDSVSIDLNEVERWSKAEGKGQEFSKIRHRFTSGAS
jgi:hypothetical protein